MVLTITDVNMADLLFQQPYQLQYRRLAAGNFSGEQHQLAVNASKNQGGDSLFIGFWHCEQIGHPLNPARTDLLCYGYQQWVAPIGIGSQIQPQPEVGFKRLTFCRGPQRFQQC